MEKAKLTKYALISLIGVAIIYIIPFIIAQSSFDASLSIWYASKKEAVKVR